MTRFWGTVSILALSALPVSAQEVFDLDTITVYANQTPQTVGQTGSTVDVAEAEDIARASQTTVADFLATVPGVSISANGGVGGTTTVRVRGLDTTYVPVLINGIEVTDPSLINTSFDWGQLALGGIDRIEIVKGTQSALYGSEAVGGIINITTLQARGETGTRGYINAELGAYGTVRSGFGVATSDESGGIALSFAQTSTDGFSALEAGEEEDGFSSSQITLDAFWNVTDNLTLGVSTYALNAAGDFDPFGGDGFAPFDQRATNDIDAARIYAELRTGAVNHVLSYSRYTNDRTSTSFGRTDPFLGERDKVDYKATAALNEAVTVTFGGDWTRETFESTEEEFLFDDAFNFLGTQLLSTSESVETTGIFAELLYQPSDALSVSLSARYDDHSEFGDFTSARLAAAYRPREDLVFRFAAGNGFRAPSLYQLHSQLFGNPDLDPETSRSAEFGVEKTYDRGFARATVFYTEIDDLIGFTSTYDQVPGTSVSQGLELAAAYDVSDALRLSGNYTLTDTETPGGGRLARVPRHDLTLAVNAQLSPTLSTQVSLQHIADRPDDGFPAEPMDDYTLVNFGASYALSPTSELYLRVENVTNTDYQTSAGFNTSDRAAYFGFRASF